jgi:predicted permease
MRLPWRTDPGRLVLSFLLEDTWRAARSLRRTPLLALSAAISIAIGVGANTTLYSWMDGLVLHPYAAIPESDRLVALEMAAPDGSGWQLSYPVLRQWRDESRSFSAMAAFRPSRAGVRDPVRAQTEPATVMEVTGNYFQTLRVVPSQGRLLMPGDETTAAQVAVLGHGYWQNRFGGSATIVGTQLTINGEPVTVVGVAPDGFRGTYVGVVPDVFVPLTLRRRTAAASLEDRGARVFAAFARLAPGASIAGASSELDALAKRLSSAAGDRPVAGAKVMLMREQFLGSILFPLFSALFVLTVLLLLVACANVASLLLVRVNARRHELAVRSALGAPRGRVASLVLAEGAVLVLGGTLGGILVSLAARDFLRRFFPMSPYPMALDVTLNPRVFAVTALAALLAALVATLGGIAQAGRVSAADAMRAGSRTVAGGRGRLRRLIVGGQVALSLACLLIAGAFLRGVERAGRIDLGLESPDRVLLVSTDFTAGQASDSGARAAADRVLAGVRALPGVTAASVASYVPLGFGGPRSVPVRVEGRASLDPNADIADRTLVSSDYFDTIGGRIVEGRGVAESDVAGSQPVAVVNETFLKKYVAPLPAIGTRIDLGRGWVTIIGVARDGKYTSPTERPRAVAWLPVRQWFQGALTLHVRATGDPTALAGPVRDVFRSASPDLPVVQPRTLENFIAASTFAERTGASIIGWLGVVVLVMAGIGLHGALATAVAARRTEIAVRVALGAGSRTVIGLVVRDAAAMIGGGFAAGMLIAWGVERFARARVGPNVAIDAVAASIAIAVLLVAAGLAAGAPAGRAVRIQPATALRDGT